MIALLSLLALTLIFFPSHQEQLPELHIHFQAQSFHTSMYASSWFLTIFLTSFPLPVATRIFDIFMCEVRKSVRMVQAGFKDEYII